MSKAQQQAQARLRAARNPQRRSDMSGLSALFGGVGGGGAAADAAAPAATKGVPLMAPGRSRDIITSRYGPRIDLGPIFRPQSTGVDPMQGDPFKGTSGVGGFFRRLLGDNSDELNAAWQQARINSQLAKEDLAAQREFEMGKISKQQENALELAKTQHEQELEAKRYATEIGANTQLALDQAMRQRTLAEAAGAPAREHAALTSALGDPIKAAQIQAAIVGRPLAEANMSDAQMRALDEQLASAQAHRNLQQGQLALQERELGMPRALGASGMISMGNDIYGDPSFRLGGLTKLNLNPNAAGAAPTPGFSPEAAAAAKDKFKQATRESGLVPYSETGTDVLTNKLPTELDTESESGSLIQQLLRGTRKR